MTKDKDIRKELTEKYGITDEGDIVSLTDLEMREEVLSRSHEMKKRTVLQGGQDYAGSI
ncbi:MAG: hypothetical protein MR940_03390 [Lachnospiraceae bacterium]|jgi:hypothetical protein|nr:hypothetical protein [Lachnospiraceae bacterium]